MIKEIQAGYLNSLYFKEIHLYLAHNKLPSSKVVIRKVEAFAEKYILLDSLLFKISTTPEKEMAVLAILETCVDIVTNTNCICPRYTGEVTRHLSGPS